jgi:HSP20 family protein
MDALEQLANDQRRRGQGTPMPIYVFEESGDVVVEAGLPGVRPEELDLSCSDNLLTIRARANMPDRDYLHQEMQSVDYVRQIALPGDCRFEQASAGLDNGLLTIRVPKARPRTPEKIRIQVNRRGAGADQSRTIDAEPGKGYSRTDPG